MALTESQKKDLEQIKADIDLLEKRLKRAHALGDSNSAGLSMTYNDNLAWYKQLQLLRGQRNLLEEIEAGENPSRAALGMTNINYVRNDQPYL